MDLDALNPQVLAVLLLDKGISQAESRFAEARAVFVLSVYCWCVTPYPNKAKSPLQGSSGHISLKESVISLAVTISF